MRYLNEKRNEKKRNRTEFLKGESGHRAIHGCSPKKKVENRFGPKGKFPEGSEKEEGRRRAQDYEKRKRQKGKNLSGHIPKGCNIKRSLNSTASQKPKGNSKKKMKTSSGTVVNREGDADSKHSVKPKDVTPIASKRKRGAGKTRAPQGYQEGKKKGVEKGGGAGGGLEVISARSRCKIQRCL